MKRKKEATVRVKLLNLKDCPFCLPYKSIGYGIQYCCKFIGPPGTLNHFPFIEQEMVAVSSNVRCSQQDMTQCILLGRLVAKEEG